MLPIILHRETRGSEGTAIASPEVLAARKFDQTGIRDTLRAHVAERTNVDVDAKIGLVLDDDPKLRSDLNALGLEIEMLRVVSVILDRVDALTNVVNDLAAKPTKKVSA